MASENDRPWYGDGLRFTCTACGNCCTGAPGYVWVNQEEISALAEIVGVQDADEFERLYVRKIFMRKSLREYSNGDCVFFNGQTRRCKVYEARPRQCRSWPFWNSNVRTPQSWARTCEVCPGSGNGRLYSLGEIESTRNVIRI
jgi:hypothetical protein